MTKELEPTEIFTQNNNELAKKLNKLVHRAVDKSYQLIEDNDRQDQIYTALRIAEVAGKITGIVKEKQQTNIQINQITGFTFIEAKNPEEETFIEQSVDRVIVENKPII